MSNMKNYRGQDKLRKYSAASDIVPPGYKKTEVGIIPEDWECVKVIDLVSRGYLERPLDGNHGNLHPKSNDFLSYGIPFIMANDIKNGFVDFDNCKFISKKTADSLQKGFAISGDVLLTHKGTIGETAIIRKLSTPYIMLTPQVTYYRVYHKEKLSNIFLRYYFEWEKFQAILKNWAGGGTRAYIGISRQLQLPIILPPPKEQKAIAATLSDVDELIARLDKLIEKKEAIKTAAMQQLLTGKIRLPGFQKKPGFKKTEVGMIPEDWEVKTIQEVCSISTGNKNTEDKANDGDYPFFVRSQLVERINSYSYNEKLF